MLFGLVGRLGPRIRQIVGIGDCPTARGNFGNLWRICAKVREPIELPFGVVNRVGPSIGVLDGVHIPQGKGRFWDCCPLF